MPIPLRTSISLGLRVVPPSAGLLSIPLAKAPIGRKVHKHASRYILTVEKDIELEKEIADSKRL